MQAVAQRHFDDAGFNQHLGALHIQPLERGLDARKLSRGGVDEQGVIDAIGHHPHVLPQRDSDRGGCVLIGIALVGAGAVAKQAATAQIRGR